MRGVHADDDDGAAVAPSLHRRNECKKMHTPRNAENDKEKRQNKYR